MISLREYDDIVTILFLPLKGINVVKEFQKTYSGLMSFYLTISRWEIPSKESIFDNKNGPGPPLVYIFELKINGQA